MIVCPFISTRLDDFAGFSFTNFTSWVLLVLPLSVLPLSVLPLSCPCPALVLPLSCPCPALVLPLSCPLFTCPALYLSCLYPTSKTKIVGRIEKGQDK